MNLLLFTRRESNLDLGGGIFRTKHQSAVEFVFAFEFN